MEHLFWTILSFATITWYFVVTAIVAYKGGIDIKNMLAKLDGEEKEANDARVK